MAAAEDQRLIDGIARVAASLGWEVLATDRSHEVLRVTITHEKTPVTSPAPVSGSMA